jgi:hypothetical protein
MDTHTKINSTKKPTKKAIYSKSTTNQYQNGTNTLLYHDKLETNMDVNPNNFIELNKLREMKLNQIGI